jgi:hypothetical protein
MPSLHELQRSFADAVFEDSAGIPLRPAGPDDMPAGARMEVYRNNVFSNLTDGLASIYGTVHALVGEEFFEHTADCYIRETPSRSGNLNDFGALFPDFLAGFQPAQGLAYLPDVARMEWLIHEALLAIDADAMDPATLAELSPADYGAIRFELHPSVRLMESDYPLLRIWELCRAGNDADEHADVDLGAGGVRLLVARPALQVDVSALGAGEYAFLHAILEGLPFEAVCTRALNADPDLDIGSALQQQVMAGLITAWHR